MMCRFSQLRRKEVINICDGSRLGCVGDLELCIPEGTVKALIVFGPCRFFGLFGRGEDYYIPWDCVQRGGYHPHRQALPAPGGRKEKAALVKKAAVPFVAQPSFSVCQKASLSLPPAGGKPFLMKFTAPWTKSSAAGDSGGCRTGPGACFPP